MLCPSRGFPSDDEARERRLVQCVAGNLQPFLSIPPSLQEPIRGKFLIPGFSALAQGSWLTLQYSRTSVQKQQCIHTDENGISFPESQRQNLMRASASLYCRGKQPSAVRLLLKYNSQKPQRLFEGDRSCNSATAAVKCCPVLLSKQECFLHHNQHHQHFTIPAAVTMQSMYFIQDDTLPALTPAASIHCCNSRIHL